MRCCMRNLMVVVVFLFISGGAAYAEPIMTVPGRDISVSFLEHCILETDVAVCLSWDRTAAGISANDESFRTVRAGMVNIPLHEMESTLEEGGRSGGTTALLIMGGLLISMSNIIRQYARRQNGSEEDKVVTAKETVSVRV